MLSSGYCGERTSTHSAAPPEKRMIIDAKHALPRWERFDFQGLIILDSWDDAVGINTDQKKKVRVQPNVCLPTGTAEMALLCLVKLF
eukprot:6190689-Pleurochrysis_carterae.AAC.2